MTLLPGGKLCIVLNQWGLITDWDCASANVHDQTFLPLLHNYDDQMIILVDAGFQRANAGRWLEQAASRPTRNCVVAANGTCG